MRNNNMMRALSNGSSNGAVKFDNDFLLKDESPVSPGWDPSGVGYTAFRVCPATNPDKNHTEWDPFRVKDNANAYGVAFQQFPVVVGAGQSAERGERISFIVADKAEYSDIHRSPYMKLFAAVSKRYEDDPNCPALWGRLISPPAGKRVVHFPKVVEGFFMNAYVYHKHPYDWVVSTERSSRIVLMKGTAGKRLFQALADEWTEAHRSGGQPRDILDMNAGAFVFVWQENGVNPLTGIANSGAKFPGFDVAVRSTYDVAGSTHTGKTAALPVDVQQAYSQRVRPWEDILNIMPYAEQAEKLSRVFPLDMCAYAWRDDREWLTTSMLNAASHTPTPSEFHPAVVLPTASKVMDVPQEVSLPTPVRYVPAAVTMPYSASAPVQPVPAPVQPAPVQPAVKPAGMVKDAFSGMGSMVTDINDLLVPRTSESYSCIPTESDNVEYSSAPFTADLG